eukprot:scaffold149840_cov13-Tisochrysis_lutea.AAC.1
MCSSNLPLLDSAVAVAVAQEEHQRPAMDEIMHHQLIASNDKGPVCAGRVKGFSETRESPKHLQNLGPYWKLETSLAMRQLLCEK